MIYELPIAIDVLDGYTSAYPPGYAPGFVEIDRVSVTPAHIRLQLTNVQLGDVGEMHFIKKGPNQTEVRFDPPGHVSAEPLSSEQLSALHRDDIIQLLRRRRDEARALHRRRVEFHHRVVRAFFNRLYADPALGKMLRRAGTTTRRGPTVKTQIRGEVFRRLKQAHPEWSQAAVAIEASEELEENVTADTVRNTYRALGWTWERADRIR